MYEKEFTHILKNGETITVLLSDINYDSWSDSLYNKGQKLGEKLIKGKNMALAYISTDTMPGIKVIANKQEYVKDEGFIVLTKEKGLIFIKDSEMRDE